MAGRRRTVLSIDAERAQPRSPDAARHGARRSPPRSAADAGGRWIRAGVSRMSVSRAERGLGGAMTMDAWQRISTAVGRPLVPRLQAPVDGQTADAGHLAMQERVLRLGRAAGYRGLVELPTRPAEPWRSIDVALVDDVLRRLLVVECWNSIGDIGARGEDVVAEAGRGRGPRDQPVGRAAPRGRARLDRAGHGAEPGAGGALPGGLRGPVPGQQRRVGPRPRDRRRTTGTTGARLDDGGRDPDLPVAPAFGRPGTASSGRRRDESGREQQLEVGANLEQLPTDERRVARRTSHDVGALGRAEHEVRQRVEVDVEARRVARRPPRRASPGSGPARPGSEASMTSIAPSTPSWRS